MQSFFNTIATMSYFFLQLSDSRDMSINLSRDWEHQEYNVTLTFNLVSSLSYGSVAKLLSLLSP